MLCAMRSNGVRLLVIAVAITAVITAPKGRPGKVHNNNQDVHKGRHHGSEERSRHAIAHLTSEKRASIPTNENSPGINGKVPSSKSKIKDHDSRQSIPGEVNDVPLGQAYGDPDAYQSIGDGVFLMNNIGPVPEKEKLVSGDAKSKAGTGPESKSVHSSSNTANLKAILSNLDKINNEKPKGGVKSDSSLNPMIKLGSSPAVNDIENVSPEEVSMINHVKADLQKIDNSVINDKLSKAGGATAQMKSTAATDAPKEDSIAKIVENMQDDGSLLPDDPYVMKSKSKINQPKRTKVYNVNASKRNNMFIEDTQISQVYNSLMDEDDNIFKNDDDKKISHHKHKNKHRTKSKDWLENNNTSSENNTMTFDSNINNNENKDSNDETDWINENSTQKDSGEQQTDSNESEFSTIKEDSSNGKPIGKPTSHGKQSHDSSYGKKRVKQHNKLSKHKHHHGYPPSIDDRSNANLPFYSDSGNVIDKDVNENSNQEEQDDDYDNDNNSDDDDGDDDDTNKDTWQITVQSNKEQKEKEQKQERRMKKKFWQPTASMAKSRQPESEANGGTGQQGRVEEFVGNKEFIASGISGSLGNANVIIPTHKSIGTSRSNHLIDPTDAAAVAYFDEGNITPQIVEYTNGNNNNNNNINSNYGETVSTMDHNGKHLENGNMKEINKETHSNLVSSSSSATPGSNDNITADELAKEMKDFQSALGEIKVSSNQTTENNTSSSQQIEQKNETNTDDSHFHSKESKENNHDNKKTHEQLLNDGVEGNSIMNTKVEKTKDEIHTKKNLTTISAVDVPVEHVNNNKNQQVIAEKIVLNSYLESPRNMTDNDVKQQSEPVKQQSEPVKQQSEPVKQQSEPVKQQLEPVKQHSEPVKQQLEHGSHQSEPVKQQPAEKAKQREDLPSKQSEAAKQNQESAKQTTDAAKQQIENSKPVLIKVEEGNSMEKETQDKVVNKISHLLPSRDVLTVSNELGEEKSEGRTGETKRKPQALKIRGGEIHGGRIAGGTISGGSINGGDIEGGTISGGDIEGGSFLNGLLEKGTLFNGTIDGGRMIGGKVYGGLMKSGLIEGGVLKGGTIEGGHLLGGSVEGGLFKGGSMEGGSLLSGEIAGGDLKNGSVEGGVLRGGFVEGGHLAGGVMTGGHLKGGVVKSGLVRGGVIEGGVIEGGIIDDGVIIKDGIVKGGVLMSSNDHSSRSNVFFSVKLSPRTAQANGTDQPAPPPPPPDNNNILHAPESWPLKGKNRPKNKDDTDHLTHNQNHMTAQHTENDKPNLLLRLKPSDPRPAMKQARNESHKAPVVDLDSLFRDMERVTQAERTAAKAAKAAKKEIEAKKPVPPAPILAKQEEEMMQFNDTKPKEVSDEVEQDIHTLVPSRANPLQEAPGEKSQQETGLPATRVMKHGNVPRYHWVLNSASNGYIPGTPGKPMRIAGDVSVHNGVASFNGVNAYLDAGDYEGQCIADPSKCDTGLTISMTIKVQSESVHSKTPKYIFDSGASSEQSRGVSLWLVRGTMVAAVATGMYTWCLQGDFQPYADKWLSVVLTWKENRELRIYINCKFFARSRPNRDCDRCHTCRELKPHPHLMFGRPNKGPHFSLTKFSSGDITIYEQFYGEDEVGVLCGSNNDKPGIDSDLNYTPLQDETLMWPTPSGSKTAHGQIMADKKYTQQGIPMAKPSDKGRKDVTTLSQQQLKFQNPPPAAFVQQQPQPASSLSQPQQIPSPLSAIRQAHLLKQNQPRKAPSVAQELLDEIQQVTNRQQEKQVSLQNKIRQNTDGRGDINGGYSPWSSWSGCTRSCGGGLQLSVRYCNKPVPRAGGKDCAMIGSARKTQSCNEFECQVSEKYAANVKLPSIDINFDKKSGITSKTMALDEGERELVNTLAGLR